MESNTPKDNEKIVTTSDATQTNNQKDLQNGAEEEDQKVTPWSVEGKIDYMKLIKQFGTEIIDDQLLERFKKITGKDLHPWLKRGIFFSHRGLNQFLTAYENGDPIFLYTGRGPTSGKRQNFLLLNYINLHYLNLAFIIFD